MKIKIDNKKLACLAIGLSILSLTGMAIYENLELKKLRHRTQSIEEKVTNIEGNGISDAEYDGPTESTEPKYEVLSQENKTIRVIDTNNLVQTYGNTQQPTYISKNVTMFKIRVTNDTSQQYNYLEGNIRGKTPSGRLIDQTFNGEIHPEDIVSTGNGTLSLLPGGQGEITVYLSNEYGEVELFFDNIKG